MCHACFNYTCSTPLNRFLREGCWVASNVSNYLVKNVTITLHFSASMHVNTSCVCCLLYHFYQPLKRRPLYSIKTLWSQGSTKHGYLVKLQGFFCTSMLTISTHLNNACIHWQCPLKLPVHYNNLPCKSTWNGYTNKRHSIIRADLVYKVSSSVLSNLDYWFTLGPNIICMHADNAQNIIPEIM